MIPDEFVPVSEMRRFFHACNLQRKKWYRELADDDALIYAYFVLRRRMLQPAHFVLRESEEQKRSLLKPEVKIAYERLKAVLQNGGDLKPYHTQNSRILYPCDGLLEMHGINHLHLLRGKYQVYFFSEGTSVFIIKVVTHFARHHTGYSKNSLLAILKNAIPDYDFRMPWLQSHSADPRLTERYASPYGWYMVDAHKKWQNANR
jgi:hypothetical protein